MVDISKDFGCLASFEFFYKDLDNDKNALTIYANGRNNVGIAVRVKVQACQKDEQGNCKMDSDGFRSIDEKKTLYIPGGDLQKMLYICDFRDGSKIESPWKITYTSNAFTRPVQSIEQRPALYSAAPLGPEGSMTDIYLSCEHSINTMTTVFALGIDIPGIGKFDTSEEGTATVDGIRKFTNPKILNITAIAPIDYSLPENIQVSGMPKKLKDLRVMADKVRIWMDTIFEPKDHLDGEGSRATVTIKPKRDFHIFQTKNVTRNVVELSHTYYPSWDKADLIKPIPGDGDQYDVVLLFVESPNYGICGKTSEITMSKSYYYIRYKIDDDRHYWYESLIDGVITMKICNHHIPHDVSKFHNAIYNDTDTVKVNVEDNYGNTGVVKIETSDKPEAIWPQFYVNGKLW